MARDFAKLFLRIWGDPSWRARTRAEQHLYELLLSQETLNAAGVLPLQPKRWAFGTADVTEDDVRSTLRSLARHRYVVVDEDTEEVLVRSFVRNDEGYRIPGMLKAVLAAAEAAQSPFIRGVLAEELSRLPVLSGKTAAEGTARIAATRSLLEATSEPIPNPIREPIPEPMREGSRNLSANPSQEPIREPIAEPMPEPSVAVAVAVAVGEVEQGGNGTEVDARASSVPDTRPAPFDEPRAEAPPAPAIEGAMPPARCRNHLELADPPACGRCREARKAQEAWIAERDWRVAEARAQAQAELAEQRRLERQQIEDCARCDDRGILPSAVACTHDHRSDPEAIPPGRAAYLAEREKLRQRALARATDPAEQTFPAGVTATYPIRSDDLDDEPPQLPAEYDDADEPEPDAWDDDGLDEQHQLDQDTWTDAEPSYVYAGGDDGDVPF